MHFETKHVIWILQPALQTVLKIYFSIQIFILRENDSLNVLPHICEMFTCLASVCHDMSWICVWTEAQKWISALYEYPYRCPISEDWGLWAVKGRQRWQRANNGSVQPSPPEIRAAIQRDWHTKECEFSHSSALNRTKDFIYHS